MLSLHRFGETSPALRIVRCIVLAVVIILTFPLLAVAENDRDHDRDAIDTAVASAATIAIPTVTPTLVPPTATPKPSPTALPPTATPRPPTATPDAFAGLTMIGSGAAAFYDPSYDSGGWDAIIRKHIQLGQIDGASFAYSPQGYYCVHPDYSVGNILTLQNPQSGKTIRCTVADAVAPGDQAVWRSRWKVELSYAAFTGLGLNDNGNIVTVWVVKS